MYYINKDRVCHRLDKFPITEKIVLGKISYETNPKWRNKIWDSKPFNTVIVSEKEFRVILKEVGRTEENLNEGGFVGERFLHFQIDDTFVRISTKEILSKVNYKL